MSQPILSPANYRYELTESALNPKSLSSNLGSGDHAQEISKGDRCWSLKSTIWGGHSRDTIYNSFLAVSIASFIIYLTCESRTCKNSRCSNIPGFMSLVVPSVQRLDSIPALLSCPVRKSVHFRSECNSSESKLYALQDLYRLNYSTKSGKWTSWLQLLPINCEWDPAYWAHFRDLNLLAFILFMWNLCL